MSLDATNITELLKSVTNQMRELGVSKFHFDAPVIDCNTQESVKVYAIIELGDLPVSKDAAEEERIQRLRDNQEAIKMAQESRRRVAASSNIGPGLGKFR